MRQEVTDCPSITEAISCETFSYFLEYKDTVCVWYGGRWEN